MGRFADNSTRITRRRSIRAPIAAAADYTIENLESRLLLSQTIYVDANSPDASGNGSSWDHAYRDLQLGLAAATAGSGDEIHVADGTYYPTSGTDRTISFVLKSGTSLLGGYGGYGSLHPDTQNPDANPTIISGNLGDPAIRTDNSYHVVIASNTDNTTLFDGFTITAGYANASSPNNRGGGLYDSAGHLTVDHCTFTDDRTASTGLGGAVYLFNAAATIRNCAYTLNDSSSKGGAIYSTGSPASSVTNCSFSGNTSFSGGAIFNNSGPLVISNCIFAGNSARSGGGVYAFGSPVLSACTFSGNSATNGIGGGVYNGGSPSLTNCVFQRNTASGDGGGLANTSGSPSLTACRFQGNSGGALNTQLGALTAINCIFSGNTGAVAGGIYNDGSVLSVINCTFASNQATVPDFGRGIQNATGTITNSVFWGDPTDTRPEIGNPYGLSVTYCDVQGGFAGTGIINADPQFVRNPSTGSDNIWGTVDDDYGDLRLRPYSPAADAGNNAAVPPTILTDIGGNSRVLDVPSSAHTGAGTIPIVDMGAYEASPALAASASGPYFVLTGLTTVLHGFGSSTLGGGLVFDWEWDGDGQFDEAHGPNPVFDSTGLPTTTPVDVLLQVSDGVSSIIATAILTVMPHVIYVDPNATGLNNGTAWSNAFTDLVTASTVAVPSQEIHVADGVYKPTLGIDRDRSFQLRNDIALMGGYAGFGAPNPDERNSSLYPAILSGDIGTVGMYDDNSDHVVVSSGTDSSARLIGFTVSAGNAYQPPGGGLYNSSGSLTVSDCIFSDNIGSSAIYSSSGSLNLTDCTFANNNAGAIYSVSSTVELSNCIFSANHSALHNENSSVTLANCVFNENIGGIYNLGSTVAVTDCNFVGNHSDRGGAIYNYNCPNVNIQNSEFTNNDVYSYDGGAIYSDSTLLTIVNCTFAGNSATYGGALYDAFSILGTRISNCIFSGNTAGAWGNSGQGGAVYNYYGNPSFVNCIFVGNRAIGSNNETYGGAIVDGDASVALIGCTFVANSVSSGRGGAIFHSSYFAPLHLRNSVLWGDSATTSDPEIGFSPPIAQTSVHYADIQGGYSGTGNINAEPLFVRNPSPGPDNTWGTADDDCGDLRLQQASPCIDAGDNNAFPIDASTDLAGNPRFAGRVDIGPYELQGDRAPAFRSGARYTFKVGVSGSYIIQTTGSPTPVLSETGSLPSGLMFAPNGNGTVTLAGTPAAGTEGTYRLNLAASNGVLPNSLQLFIFRIATGTLYVDANTTVAANDQDGSSWATAYSSLQMAMAAATAGDRIDVARGNYLPTTSSDRTSTFQLMNGVSIYGGYAGVTTANPGARDVVAYPTTLSGDIGVPGINSDNSFHVVVGSGTNATAILDGFTVTAGKANGGAFGQNRGGGLYVYDSSPTIRNCIFSGNTASLSGGGFYNFGPSILINCMFIRNTASSSGGGMASIGAPTLTNCIFDGNTAGGGGGLDNGGSACLTNCTFSGNSGAGMSNGNNSLPTLTNCSFSGNTASGGGGAIQDSGAPTFINCIIWGNPAPGNVEISHIFGEVSYSDVKGGWDGYGFTDINADPLFIRNPSPGPDNTWGTVDDDYGDLRLQTGSPCIDAGSDAAVPVGVTTDLAGNPRFVDVPFVNDGGPAVDMGVYEYLPAFAATGFAVGGTANQLGLRYTFSLDPDVSSLDTSDIELTDLTDPSATLPAVTDVSFDPASHQTAWNLAGWLGDGDYSVKLKAGSVTASTGTSLPNDNIETFFILVADANHDRYVNTLDFTALAANFGQSGKTYADGDFNYDGNVNSLDFNALASKFGTYLAPAAGELPAAAQLPLASGPSAGSLFSARPIDPIESSDLSQLI